MPQRGSQLLVVVGKDLRVVCAARDGNVGHAVVEQVFGSQLGIGMDEYPVGGLALAAVTRHRVAVVEVRIPDRIKLDDTITLAASVHLQTHPPILDDAFEGPKLTVGQLQVGKGCGELFAISPNIRSRLVGETRRFVDLSHLGVV